MLIPTPLIPLIVSKQHLLSANALFGMIIYGSILFAYILSGPLIILFGAVNTVLILAGMLFVSVIFIYLIKIKQEKIKLENAVKRPHILKDIRHTFSILSRVKDISNSLFLLALSQILILIIATIAPGYAHQILGINVEEFPIVFIAPAALGTVLGGIVVVHFFHSHPKNRVINIGLFLAAFAILLMPYGSKVASRGFIQVINTYLPHFLQIDILHIMVVIALLLGIANALVFVPANTLIQEKTTDEIRGRIYGFLNTIVGALSLLPVIIVGGLSDLIGVGWVLTGVGISILGLGIMRQVLRKF